MLISIDGSTSLVPKAVIGQQ